MLSYRQFLVKERVSFIYSNDVYDIYDPETGDQIGYAVENPPFWACYARMLLPKNLLPTRVEFFEDESGGPIMTLYKKPGLFKDDVRLYDALDNYFGSLKTKSLLQGGGFFVYDAGGSQVAEVRGDWKGRNYKILSDTGRKLAVVTQKWAGFAKEVFTTSDTYMISVNEHEDAQTVALALATALAIDTAFE
jgi:uncharacterized protein YxjI